MRSYLKVEVRNLYGRPVGRSGSRGVQIGKTGGVEVREKYRSDSGRQRLRLSGAASAT